ncbi:MAG: ABC transporter ATP-binding protein [Chloroflexi bacterium]|nr:ABC transporter ATP-binding protein [Chloroflexota bacterium]MBP7044199.1 ABC transporter ATP-binding protein [Chloroflexota bacterium]
MTTFGRLLRYVRPYTRWMVLSIIMLLISVSLGLILPLVIRNLVDIVLVDKNFPRLNQLAIGLFVVFLLQGVASFVNQIALAFVGENVVADIRVQVYSHLQSLSLKYFTDNRTGEIVSRVTNDVVLLQTAVTDNLVALLRQAITLIGAAILLFILDWRLTVIILLGIPFVTLTMVWLGRKIRRESTAVQDALAQGANVLEETISGVRIVKSFAREEYEIGRFSARVTDIFDAAMRRAKIGAVLGPVIGFMAFGSITITLWFGSYEVIQGRLTAGDLVAYLIYTMLVAAPIASLAGLYAQFQSAIGATERLFDLLDTESDIVSLPDAPLLPAVNGEVVFEDVSFAYSTAVALLRSVSFTARPGQVIALVGPSGAGKSTLVSLIPRFWDVDNGRVTIDGHDIREVNLRSLREQIGIVPQETTLFSDTVYNNIRYGKLDATREEVEAAARAANAHDFILNDLAEGYDTPVGERGVKLSGGQRQRVAIARAVLKDPRILILDEATSSLDSESESLVQEALERLMAGRTSFVIAHRLSTVVNADWVLVLDAGRIVEQGTHADLLARADGLYTRLHQMQFGSAELV